MDFPTFKNIYIYKNKKEEEKRGKYTSDTKRRAMFVKICIDMVSKIILKNKLICCKMSFGRSQKQNGGRKRSLRIIIFYSENRLVEKF